LRQTLIAFALAIISTIGSYNIPVLLGRTRPQTLGPLMDDNVVYQHVLLAEAEAVISFALAALVGVLYVVALYRQRWR
jgi:ABC-type spermidine/putrescine transport system permease subunit I